MNRGSLSPGLAAILAACVKAGLNVLVSGQTQAGKTTMLNCLASAIPQTESLPGLATLHANSAREALTKLCTFTLLAGRGTLTGGAPSADSWACRRLLRPGQITSDKQDPTGRPWGPVLRSECRRSCDGAHLRSDATRLLERR